MVPPNDSALGMILFVLFTLSNLVFSELKFTFHLSAQVLIFSRSDFNSSNLILTPCSDIIEKVGVLPPVNSDHCCTFVEIKNTGPVQTCFRRTLYNYSKLNEERFLDKGRNTDWNDIVTSGTVDMVAELISKEIMKIGIACMPVKTITVKENDTPWITEEIKKLIKKKQKIHALAKTLDSVWSWNLFKRTRNHLVDLIRKRKGEYQKDLENKINAQVNFGTKDW